MNKVTNTLRWWLITIGAYLLCGFLMLRNALDIRKRSWWTATLMFYGVCFFVLLLGWKVKDVNARLRLTTIQVQTMRRNVLEQQAAARTLQVAYGFSDDAADFYATQFRKQARLYGYPWEAISALTKRESNFNIRALSPMGAQGLLQLLPGTGKMHAAKLGIVFVNDYTLFHPVYNITLAGSYFNDCWSNSYKGQERLNEAFRRYLLGCAYKKVVRKPNKNLAVKKVTTDYCSDVLSEYQKLYYIYRGALSMLTKG